MDSNDEKVAKQFLGAEAGLLLGAVFFLAQLVFWKLGAVELGFSYVAVIFVFHPILTLVLAARMLILFWKRKIVLRDAFSTSMLLGMNLYLAFNAGESPGFPFRKGELGVAEFGPTEKLVLMISVTIIIFSSARVFRRQKANEQVGQIL